MSPGGIGRRGVLGVAAASLAPAVLRAEADAGPALRRGVNLTSWFEYGRGKAVSPRELDALWRSGFDHVRIPLDPVVFGWRAAPRSEPTFLSELRAAIDAALQAGLDITVDLHPTAETKQAIERDRAHEAALLDLWAALAAGLADTPPGRVAVELLNEPAYEGAAAPRWPALQRRLLATVRRALPRHLVLLTGAMGGGVEGLAALDPVADRRVAYVFHFYLPYLFTHQGVRWLDSRWTSAGLYHDIRYPASAQAGTRPTLSRPHPSAAAELRQYLSDDWRAERIALAMRPAFDWARRHGARTLCNEFGVIRDGVEPASRHRWLADVRSTLEAHGVGWTVWDYCDLFGIAAEPSLPDGAPGRGTRTVEPAALQALGLKAS